LREIDVLIIEKKIEELFISANYHLPESIKDKINASLESEDSKLGNEVLSILKENYIKSENGVYPICQDTGMAIVFMEIGQDIKFINGYIIDAINNGVRNAYLNGYLRKSIVEDPLFRKNTADNTPAVIHTEIVKGDKVKISVAPKGFGSENQSGLKMLVPSDGRDGIIDFIVKGVIETGGKGCPPCVIGVGIGGNFEYSALLAKKALLLDSYNNNLDPFYKEMEDEILDKINESNVGPMGLGGKATCLGVNILTYPTHIAGLPVAYNYSCHASRHKSAVI